MALHLLSLQSTEAQELADQTDLAAWVASKMAQSDDQIAINDEQQTKNQVLMLFTAIGKFVAFMFRKTHYETVVADVFGLGHFIRNCTIGKIGVTEFFPSAVLQQETRIFKKYPTNLKEPTQRQELTLSKLAQVCSLPEDVTHKIL